jgi:hypothetical protein
MWFRIVSVALSLASSWRCFANRMSASLYALQMSFSEYAEECRAAFAALSDMRVLSAVLPVFPPDVRVLSVALAVCLPDAVDAFAALPGFLSDARVLSVVLPVFLLPAADAFAVLSGFLPNVRGPRFVLSWSLM